MLKVLAQTKAKDRAKAKDKHVRGDYRHLQQFLAVSVHDYRKVRSIETFRTRTYNVQRQLIELINHLFVEYRVPYFMYRAVLNAKGLQIVFGEQVKENKEVAYLDWFMAVAQGRSLAKVLHGWMTKKEVHCLLSAPDHGSFYLNSYWARFRAAGVSAPGCDFVIERLAHDMSSLGKRFDDFARLVMTIWPEIRIQEREEIFDFLRAKVRDDAYSFKGRTLGSLRKQSYKWHRNSYGIKGNVVFQAWTPFFDLWEKAEKGHTGRVMEITNTRALFSEGRLQRHCVYSYTSRCLAGVTSILAMDISQQIVGGTDRIEVGRITMEYSRPRKEIVQIRGKLNRRATELEMRFIRLWAGEKGVLISPHA